MATNLSTAAPAITDPLGNGYQNIQNLAEAVASRFETEHTTIRNAAPTDHEGMHKAGSAVAFFQETKPASRLGGVGFIDADRGLLWIQPMPSLAAMTYIKIHILTSIAAGGTFELLEEFDIVKTNTITERVADSGVTIEGILHKDNAISGATTITSSGAITTGSTTMDGTRVKCKAVQFGVKPASPENGDIWLEP